MEPIDVVLVGVTGMLAHIVKGILDVPDVRVSAEYPLEGFGSGRVDADADVVIFASEPDGVPPPIRAFFGARPRAKLLTIHDDGRRASLFELRPHETDLGQVSPQALLEAVRTARTAPL